jgi:hypothetical protein
VALAEIRDFGWLCLVMVAGGVAWIALMASFNIATQSAAPSWVRARALALYLLIFQGSMAAGSAVWGAVAERAGISTALDRSRVFHIGAEPPVMSHFISAATQGAPDASETARQ